MPPGTESEQQMSSWFTGQGHVQGEPAWQPVLEVDEMEFGLDVWFPTEAECIEFIRAQVAGAPLEYDVQGHRRGVERDDPSR